MTKWTKWTKFKFYCLSALVFFLPLVRTNAAINTVNLEESFRKAIERSEDVATQMELIAQAEERYSQALGAVLPSVNFVGTYLKQDSGSSSPNLSPIDQRTYKLSASQPLFRGFREYAALKKTKIDTEGQALLKEQAVQQLFLDTLQAFYQVLAIEKDKINLTSELDVNQKRLKEVAQFKKLGRSRASDVLSVESNIATLESNLEMMNTNDASARSVYTFLTGLDKSTALSESEKFPINLLPISDYLARIEERPDVKAAIAFRESSERGVSIARGGHLPSLDLGANYYFLRPGYLSNVKWDASLALTLPIFQGGIISSQVTIAASDLKTKELALSKARRMAAEQIDNFYSQATGDLAQIEKQKRAIAIYGRNYEAEMKDYRYGLVNNLEVLLALNTFQESKRTLDRLLYQFKTDYLKLETAAAKRPFLLSKAKP